MQTNEEKLRKLVGTRSDNPLCRDGEHAFSSCPFPPPWMKPSVQKKWKSREFPTELTPDACRAWETFQEEALGASMNCNILKKNNVDDAIFEDLQHDKTLLESELAAAKNIKVPPVQSANDVIPKKYLKNWNEILDCLEQKNNDENKRFVASMNEQYDGPIKLPGRGGQPKVEKTKLIEWWNHLETLWATQGQGRNTETTVDSNYQFGKRETVFPEINGHVKKRQSKK
jgi:hypothetical protein